MAKEETKAVDETTKKADELTDADLDKVAGGKGSGNTGFAGKSNSGFQGGGNAGFAGKNNSGFQGSSSSGVTGNKKG